MQHDTPQPSTGRRRQSPGIQPHRTARIPGSTVSVTRNTDLRLTASCSSQSCSVIWSRGCGRAIPALFTRMATGPSASVARSTILATSLAIDTSAWMVMAWPPILMISVQTASASVVRV